LVVTFLVRDLGQKKLALYKSGETTLAKKNCEKILQSREAIKAFKVLATGENRKECWGTVV